MWTAIGTHMAAFIAGIFATLAISVALSRANGPDEPHITPKKLWPDNPEWWQ